MPSAPKAKSGASSGRASGGRAQGNRSPKAKASPRVKNTHQGHSPIDTDADAEEAAGYARHRAAELEEEGRKHISADGDAEARREEDAEHIEHLKRISWGEERKRRNRRNRRDPNDDTEDGEEAARAAQEAVAKGLTGAEGAGKYFQDLPEDRMGDPSLHDPNEMKRILGPSVRFAQHAMLLAQDKMDGGTSRAEAIQYLAQLYDGVGDRSYANKALREFGAATGIMDIYPLEVVEHLMAHVPGFFSKLQRGRFMSTSGPQGYEAKAGEAIPLSYPSDLRIRGFAIKGGDRPGYLLEPTEPVGTYKLVFLTAGRFEVLISAIGKDGCVYLEEFECRIEPGADAPEPSALEKERARQAELQDDIDSEKKKAKKDDLKIHFHRRI